MAPTTRSQPIGNIESDAQDDGSQDTGTKRSRKMTIHSDDDAHTPTETAGTSGKKKGRSKKKTLAFEVEQVHDNDNIFEGRVQENVEDIDPNKDKDGSFSLEDMDREYEPFAIPGDLNREINTDNGLGLSTKNIADDGFIPLMGFQSNSAFNSLRNSPVNRKEPLPSDKPWRKGEQHPTDDMRLDTEIPVCPNTVDPEPLMSLDFRGNGNTNSKRDWTS